MIEHTHLIEAWRGDRKVISLWVSYEKTGGAKRRIHKEARKHGQGLTWKLFRVWQDGSLGIAPILEFTS